MTTPQTQESIRNTVFAIVAKQAKLDIAVLKPESTLKDLGVESLTAIDAGTLQHLIEAVEGALAGKQAKA